MSQGQDILKVNKRFLILIRSCELNARFHVGHFKSVRLVSGEWIHQAKVINFRLLYRSTRKCITSTCSQMYGLWRENPLRRWKVLGDTTSHTKTISTTWNEKNLIWKSGIWKLWWKTYCITTTLTVVYRQIIRFELNCFLFK